MLYEDKKMRLTTSCQNSIKNTFINVFKEEKIYFFASRIDDYQKGGDIDLYIDI